MNTLVLAFQARSESASPTLHAFEPMIVQDQVIHIHAAQWQEAWPRKNPPPRSGRECLFEFQEAESPRRSIRNWGINE